MQTRAAAQCHDPQSYEPAPPVRRLRTAAEAPRASPQDPGFQQRGFSRRSPAPELESQTHAKGRCMNKRLIWAKEMTSPAGAVPTAPGALLPHLSTAPSPHSPSTAMRRKVWKSTDATTAHIQRT